MMSLLERLDGMALRLSRVQFPWWLWPVTLVAAAVFALSASLLLHPASDEFVYFPNGQRFGETCAFIVWTGAPCPQCGMTRSWVHAARLDPLTSFVYSPGGFALFVWVLIAGMVGVVRLIRRDPEALHPPWQFNVAWGTFWLVALYAIPWVLRLFGVNPLP